MDLSDVSVYSTTQANSPEPTPTLKDFIQNTVESPPLNSPI